MQETRSDKARTGTPLELLTRGTHGSGCERGGRERERERERAQVGRRRGRKDEGSRCVKR
jgi:hypothetical protein